MAYIDDRLVHDADAHIMEPPNWLRDHADPDIRDRIERPGYANELAQTGDGDHGGDQERIDAAFERLTARHRTDEFLADEDVEVMNRKNFAATGLVPGRRPAAGARLDRRAEPADVQHLPQQPAPSVGAPARSRPRLRRGAGPQPRHGRVLLGRSAAACHLLRAARRLRAGRGHGRRSDRDGRRRAAGRVGLPDGSLAVARRPRSGLAPGRGGRHPDRVPRRRHRRPDRSGLLRQRPADPRRLPRRRGELPLGRLHGHSVPAHADPRHADLRRRARTVPRPAHRCDRAGLQLAAELDEADGVGDRCVRPPRGAAAEALAAAERVRRAPGAGDALSDRGRRLGHRPDRPERAAVQHRLPPRRGWPPPVRAVREQPRRPVRRRSDSASMPTTSST